jgi:hypothetical protein
MARLLSILLAVAGLAWAQDPVELALRLQATGLDVRVSALTALLRSGAGSESAYPALVQALVRDEDLDHKIAARALFSDSRTSRETSVLLEGLRLGTKARAAAAWELAHARSSAGSEVTAALVESLKHPDKHERNFVMLALAMTAQPSAGLVTRLIAALNAAGEPGVPQQDYKYPRAMAALALGIIGVDAVPAAASLTALAQSAEWEVQKLAARWALARLNGDKPAARSATSTRRLPPQELEGLAALGRFAGSQIVSSKGGGKKAPAVHESITLAIGYINSLPSLPDPRDIDREERAGVISDGVRRYVMALGGVQQGIAPALLEAFEQGVINPGASERGLPRTHTYKTLGERKLQLAMHYPHGWSDKDKRTAILFFSGAHRVVADENGKLPPLAAERRKLGLPVVNRGPGENHALYCDALAKRGYVAMRVEYRTRGRDGVLPGEDIPDALSAMRWVRSHASELGIDPARVIAAGGSSGAYLAASTFAFEDRYPLGNDPKVPARPNAILLYSPLVDWLEVGSMSPAFMVVLGGDQELGARISPARHWRKDAPPAYVMVGTKEPPFETVRQFAAKWMDAGARIELFVADDAPHGFFWQPEWSEKTLAQTERFLRSLGY